MSEDASDAIGGKRTAFSGNLMVFLDAFKAAGSDRPIAAARILKARRGLPQSFFAQNAPCLRTIRASR
jgi:hypothetical protein